MLDQPGLIVTTDTFPMAEGEDEENANPGMYGKLICAYIKNNLPNYGVQVPGYVNEDWGWWVYAQLPGFTMGLCIYSDAKMGANPHRYVILSSIEGGKKWSWQKFRRVDVSEDVGEIFASLERLFTEEDGVKRVEMCDGFPF